jgi:tripartite-type tricarboxylate transporter receptor subunit TctC
MALARPAPAQAPHRLARILVGFPPGGSLDVVARTLAEQMKGYAESVIVENRPGAGGRIVLEALKSVPLDGSTFVLTPGDQLTLFPHIYKSLAYDALRDFTPVSTVCSVQFLLTIGSMVPANIATLQGFLDWCRANPRLASFGTPGAGTRQHFMGMGLARAAGIELVHVPYKGAPQAMQDLTGGHVAATISVASNALSGVNAGQIRALMTSAARRSTVLPQVPTAREMGYPAAEAVETFGLLLPRGAPQDVVAALNTATRQALASKNMLESLGRLGFEAAGSTPAEFASVIKSDLERWSRAVQEIGFQPLE